MLHLSISPLIILDVSTKILPPGMFRSSHLPDCAGLAAGKPSDRSSLVQSEMYTHVYTQLLGSIRRRIKLEDCKDCKGSIQSLVAFTG